MIENQKEQLDSQESLYLMYEENNKLFYHFLDWRYKVMTRFFISIAGIFVVSQWMLSETALKGYLFIPCFVGVIFSIFVAFMDETNQKVLRRTMKTGAIIESKLISFRGIHRLFDEDHYEKGSRKLLSYKILLRILYGTSTGVFIGLTVYTSIKFAC